MRTAVRKLSVAAMLVALLVFVAVGVMQTSEDGQFAVMRDTLMEPAVPLGALVVMPDSRGFKEGDLIAYYPDEDAVGEWERVLFGQGLVRRVVAGSDNSWVAIADARPDLAPQLLPTGRYSYNAVAYYVPLLGYVFWFGLIGLLVLFVLGLAGLFLAREPGQRVVVAPTRDTTAIPS
jgi:hypothetical protein